MTIATEARTDITAWLSSRTGFSEETTTLIGIAVETAATLGNWTQTTNYPESLDDIQNLTEDILPVIHIRDTEPEMMTAIVASVAAKLGYRHNKA